MSNAPNITISSQDADRLDRLLETLPVADEAVAQALAAELNRADVVDSEDMPANVVTMNSTVKFRFVDSGETFCKTLSYPADSGEDRVSILAPVGSALLGLTVGDSIAWPHGDGNRLDVQVEEILYQPERDGPRTVLPQAS